MKKKLSSLYGTFVPCKSFVSDFFIVEKTFAFYEKCLFSEEKTFAIFRFTIFEGRNFRENRESFYLRKFLPLKYIQSSQNYFHANINLPRLPKTDTSSNLLLIIIIWSKYHAYTFYEGEV